MARNKKVLDSFWRYCNHSGIHGFQYLTDNWTSKNPKNKTFCTGKVFRVYILRNRESFVGDRDINKHYCIRTVSSEDVL